MTSIAANSCRRHRRRAAGALKPASAATPQKASAASMCASIDLHAHWFPAGIHRPRRQGGRQPTAAKIGRNDKGEVSLRRAGDQRRTSSAQYNRLSTSPEDDGRGQGRYHAMSLTSPWFVGAARLRAQALGRPSTMPAPRSTPIPRPLPRPRHAGRSCPDPSLAIARSSRAAASTSCPGIRGVYMATHVKGRTSTTSRYGRSYERCEGLGLPVFLHPVDPVAPSGCRAITCAICLGTPTIPASRPLADVRRRDGCLPQARVMLPPAAGPSRC